MGRRVYRGMAQVTQNKCFVTFSESYRQRGYCRAPYGLKVPFPPGRPTARVVLEQTSGEGCFDERPRSSNERWGVLFCVQTSTPVQSRSDSSST